MEPEQIVTPPGEETVPPETPPEEAPPEEPPVEEPPAEEDEVKKGLDEIRQEMRKLHDRYGYIQRQLEKVPEPKPSEKPAEQTTKPKPVPGQFENYDDYIDAFTDWKIEQRDNATRAITAKQEQKARQEAFFTKIDKAKKKHPDFDEVARKPPQDGGPTINQPMYEALMDCDHAADIAYWLGQNVEESRRIGSLSPIAAAREIGKLEAQFAGPTPPPQKKTTKAPAVTKPVGGKETLPKKWETMTESEEDVSGFISSRNKAEFGT